jgi:3-oxoacyl-[acyl-carrier-protein] synthase III
MFKREGKMIKIKILGTGAYLPSESISSENLEKKLGFAPGTFEITSGVKRRYHVKEETSSEMGANAARQAILNSSLELNKIDAVICVSGVPQQAIPSTAALIHQKLGLKRGVAFDINASCLSFLTGLVCMGNMIAQGFYRHVLLISSDIASVGLNPCDPKTASLFGDGAAAVVLGPSSNASQGILAFDFETRSERVQDCQCEGGGTLLAMKKGIPKKRLFFQMNGPQLFKSAMPPLLKMVRSLLKKVEGTVDLVIPHQASPFALDLLQKKLKLHPHKFVHIVREYGNMIATSLPFALHWAIQEKRVQRKDRILFIGTGAGLTIGGVILEY